MCHKDMDYVWLCTKECQFPCTCTGILYFPAGVGAFWILSKHFAFPTVLLVNTVCKSSKQPWYPSSWFLLDQHVSILLVLDNGMMISFLKKVEFQVDSILVSIVLRAYSFSTASLETKGSCIGISHVMLHWYGQSASNTLTICLAVRFPL